MSTPDVAVQPRWWNVNEDGQAYDSHPTEAAARLVQAEFPNDVVVQATSAEEAERLAFPPKLELPRPNETGPSASTIIASVWMRDDVPEPFALLLVMIDQPPYYRLYEITWRNGDWEPLLLEEHYNIVPAVEAYANNGGDY